MSKPAYVEAAIDQAYELGCLLRVLALAVDGEQIAGVTLSNSGGGPMIELAAKMAGEISEELETGKAV